MAAASISTIRQRNHDEKYHPCQQYGRRQLLLDGTLTDGGGNLEDGSSCGFSAATSKSNTNPLLGTLGNYGGSTQTFPLLPGSPAIDAGVSATCAAAVGSPDYGAGGQDQRGVTRPSACDIGAFESQGFTLGSLTGAPQSAAHQHRLCHSAGSDRHQRLRRAGGGRPGHVHAAGFGRQRGHHRQPGDDRQRRHGQRHGHCQRHGRQLYRHCQRSGGDQRQFCADELSTQHNDQPRLIAESIQLGDSVTFTATISPSEATGTVEFQDGGTDIPGCGNVSVSAGQATCTTSTLAARHAYHYRLLQRGHGL